jgi:hypothetical protein
MATPSAAARLELRFSEKRSAAQHKRISPSARFRTAQQRQL